MRDYRRYGRISKIVFTVTLGCLTIRLTSGRRRPVGSCEEAFPDVALKSSCFPTRSLPATTQCAEPHYKQAVL